MTTRTPIMGPCAGMCALFLFLAFPALAQTSASDILDHVKRSYICPDSYVTLEQAERYGLACANRDAVLSVADWMARSKWTVEQARATVGLFAMGHELSLQEIPGARNCAAGAQARLEFFLSGNCPMAEVWVTDAFAPLVEALDRSLQWTPYYILSLKSDGNLSSPRGPDELADALRGVCVREKAGVRRWLQYYICTLTGRNTWRDCVFPTGMSAGELHACVTEEAPALALADIRKTMEYRITGSPVFILNCAKRFGGNLPWTALKAMVCDEFGAVKPPGCVAAKPE